MPDLCGTFSMKNLISGKTCAKSVKGRSIDAKLTNKSQSFHSTSVIEADVSDCGKFIVGA